MTSLKWITASLLILGGFMWMGAGNGTLSQSAFADVIPGVDDVQTMTWTTTFYLRTTSTDGQRTWLRPEKRLHEYRHPGQYRETFLDEAGKPRTVTITDARSGRVLVLDLRNKKAVLKVPGELPDVRGPFAWVGEVLRERVRVRSISVQGQKKVDEKLANVVRATIQSGNGQTTFRNDFLFDVESKQLVGCWNSDEKDFDPETAADRNKPAEETYKITTCVANLRHEIVVNPKLDPSDFSLDPPAGYALETIAKPTLTEEEMVAYLGAAARFNDNTFPDSPDEACDSKKLNVAWEKSHSARSSAEQEMIQLDDRIKRREIYQPPLRKFEVDQTVPKSFYYVGSGVKVGQADRIVCWYKFRNATKYRAIYGDLSIKDLTAAELPLNLSN